MLRHTRPHLLHRRQAGACLLSGPPGAPPLRALFRGPTSALQQQQQQRQRRQQYCMRASVRGLVGSASDVHTPRSAAAAAATATAAAATAAQTPAAGPPRGPKGPLWGFVRREEPSQAVEAFLNGDRGNSKLLLLTGSEGVGKASLLRDCATRLAQQQTRQPILLAFDVGMMGDGSFSAFLSVARRAASRQLAAACSDINPVLLLQHIASCCPSFAASVAAGLHAAAAAAAAAARRSPRKTQQQPGGPRGPPVDFLLPTFKGGERIGCILQSLEGQVVQTDGDSAVWRDVTDLLIGPDNLSNTRPQTVLNAALLLLSEAAVLKSQASPTTEAAQEWLECLYAAMEFVQGATQRPVTLLLRSPEALLEGEGLRFQGTPFFHALLATATAEARSVGTVFSVADGVTAILVRGVDTPQTLNSHGTPQTLNPNASEPVQVLEVEELSKEDVRELFAPLLCADVSVADAAFLAVGGNPRLLQIIFEDLQRETRQLLQELARPDAGERAAAERRQQDFDDLAAEPSASQIDHSVLQKNAFYQGELLLFAATAFKRGPPSGPLRGPLGQGGPQEPQHAEQELLQKFLKVHDMQQQRLRLMSETLLVEEFRKFEALTLHFLNFPLLRKLRDVSKNEVHFLVVVCETIRAFLRRPYVLCPDLEKLNNTILLGLLDAGLVRPKFSPPRLEVAGLFYKNLLLSFCNLKYECLSTAQKADYSLNLLLNQKHIETCLDTLKNPKP